MDAWWPKLLTAEFEPRLGSSVLRDLKGMLGFGSVYTGTDPNEPDFAQGWFGYVSSDLLDLLAERLASPPGSERVHGRSTAETARSSRCRSVLRSSLLAAMRRHA